MQTWHCAASDHTGKPVWRWSMYYWHWLLLLGIYHGGSLKCCAGCFSCSCLTGRISLYYSILLLISGEPRAYWCCTLRGELERGTNLILNTGIYLTLLILLCLCLCSNYTPSGISPGKIPSHPSHSAVLIAADLQVRTRANFPVKDSGSDGELAGYTARGGWRFEGWWVFCPTALRQPQRPAQRLWTCQCPVISNAAAAAWLWMCPGSFPPVNPHKTGHEQRLALEAQLFSCMQN